MYLSQAKSSFRLYNSEQMPESVNSLSHLPNVRENEKNKKIHQCSLQKKCLFILIYLGLPILGRVIPTAYGANYCRLEHPVPPLEVDNHTGNYPLLFMNSAWLL